MKYILTCRHGQSFKNIQDVSGGKGAGLTDIGIVQVKAAAKEIGRLIYGKSGLKVKMYRSCDRVQLIETSDIISQEIGVRCERDSKFVPIRLGVFDGMNGKKQRELYPNSAQEMQEWCDGTRDIMDVHVEGMQNPGDHVNGIIEFLNDIEDNTLVILIGTRSDLSAVKNITLGNHPWVKDTFRFFYTDFAELNGYSINSNLKITEGNNQSIKHVFDYNPVKELVNGF